MGWRIAGALVALILLASGLLDAHRTMAPSVQPTAAAFVRPVLDDWADPRDLMLRGCTDHNEHWIALTGLSTSRDSDIGVWRATADVACTTEARMKAHAQLLYLRGDLEGCEEMSIHLQVLYGKPWTGTLKELRSEFMRVGIHEHLHATMPDAFATVPPDTKAQRAHWTLMCRVNATIEETKRIFRGERASTSEFDAKVAACE
jgi:hypothetical protein